MSSRKVSGIYAASLYEMAKEKNILESLVKEVEDISVVIEKNAELQRILSNPVIKPSDKYEILIGVFRGKLSPDFTRFLSLLRDKNRIELTGEVMRSFIELKNEMAGLLPVKVLTASVFSEEQLAALKTRLEQKFNKKIVFEMQPDDTLIGGFILKIGDTVIDASLSNQLQVLKKKFINSNISLN